MNDKNTDPPHGAADEPQRPKRKPGDRRTHNRRASDRPNAPADNWQGLERRRGDRRTHDRRGSDRQGSGRRASDRQQSGLPSTPQELQELIREIVVEQQEKTVPQKPRVKQATADPALPRSAAELQSMVGGMVSEIVEGSERVRSEAERHGAEQLPAATAKAKWLRLSTKQIVAAAAVLVALVAAPVAWILWPRDAEIPDGMVGLWTTTDPRYADRAFRVTKTTLTFHVGPQDSTYHDIVRVRAKKDNIATQFTVYYTQSGLELEFPLLYVESPGPTILLPNQREMTWRKQES